MKTSLFDFTLPDNLIATQPASPRDSARMLVVGNSLSDLCVADLPEFLRAGDVMVFNDTRVIPARLFGKRGEAKIEILLHKNLTVTPSDDGVRTQQQVRGDKWQCFAKPAKKLRVGDNVIFADDFCATVKDKLPSGEVVLQFDYSNAQLHSKLAEHGHMPLPPYIEKQRSVDRPILNPSHREGQQAEAGDIYDYQTIYAKHEGSVAAPTAGLHFTPELMAAIDAAGVKRVHVTLHVGGGTFLPVKTDDTSEHLMHSEYAIVSEEAASAINTAKEQDGRVICVGTTSLRTLESAADDKGKLHAFAGETNIFITPGYQFKIVDVLMTNFHLPKSTLFMLVSAFCGLERMKNAYDHAIASKYRFYSYGDACLLFRQLPSLTDHPVLY